METLDTIVPADSVRLLSSTAYLRSAFNAESGKLGGVDHQILASPLTLAERLLDPIERLDTERI